jgi:hypothetical protein
MESEYIQPTKEYPIFQIINTYEGYIVNDYLTYKNWEVKNSERWTVGETSATNLPDAMQALFEHIKNNSDKVKAKYIIEMIDGTADKYGDPIHTPVYKISMKQAKRFRLID